MVEKSRKIVYLEFLRIVAIILVIFNHTYSRGYVYYTQLSKSFSYYFFMLLSVVCKIAVPLFWMISGAIHLKREESIEKIYKHRIWKMFLVLIIFSVLQYIRWNSGDFSKMSFVYFFRKLYEEDFAESYWFLYSYIGMLMILPLIRIMVRGMKDKDYWYLFGVIVFVRGVMPIIIYLISHALFEASPEDIWQMNIYFKANFFTYNIMFFVAGHYFENIISEDALYSKRSKRLMIILSITSLIITCAMTQYKIQLTHSLTESDVQYFYENLIFAPAFSFFILIKSMLRKDKVSEGFAVVINILAGATFGVMLYENVVRTKLDFIYVKLEPICSGFIACTIWVIMTYIVSVIITLVLKKVPIINRLL